MRMVRVTAAGALALAAGCGGILETPGFDGLQDGFEAIDQEIASLPLIDPALLPASGGATYDGVMVLGTNGQGGVPDAMAGDLALDVDFDDDTLTGAVDAIRTDTDERLAGTLVLTNGRIDRGADLADEYTFGFDLNGTLTDEGDDDLVVVGEGAGDFYGSGATHVGGIVDGIVAGPGGNASLQGEFAGVD